MVGKMTDNYLKDVLALIMGLSLIRLVMWLISLCFQFSRSNDYIIMLARHHHQAISWWQTTQAG